MEKTVASLQVARPWQGSTKRGPLRRGWVLRATVIAFAWAAAAALALGGEGAGSHSPAKILFAAAAPSFRQEGSYPSFLRRQGPLGRAAQRSWQRRPSCTSREWRGRSWQGEFPAVLKAGARSISTTAVGAGGEAEKSEGLLGKLQLVLYIFLWYVLNIGYNIYNKRCLNLYPFPWASALWQMAFGWLIFVPLWALGLRRVPRLTLRQAGTLLPSALGHLATHVGAVVAFSAGAVSFGHIVKASEPVVSSVLNFVLSGEVLRWPVYSALMPIILGVGLASASELSFNWLCFGAAMASNLGSAARAVYSKKVMSGGSVGENMNEANIYAVLTIMATLMLIPISLYMEGPAAMLRGFSAAYAAGGSRFLWQMVYTGFFYYMYNEVAFQALGRLDPVSHAVSNTMKRVVIIITSVIVFRTAVTPLGIAGSSIAILGTLLYSLAKNTFK